MVFAHLREIFFGQFLDHGRIKSDPYALWISLFVFLSRTSEDAAGNACFLDGFPRPSKVKQQATPR
jgi:hypothetical protein